MNREKQIEKMAKDMCDCCKAAVENGNCPLTVCEDVRDHARALYEAGYRKQSEVERLLSPDGINPTTDVVPNAEYEAAIIDRNAARLGMIAEHERLQMARAAAAREFAKYLIDTASHGVIHAFDLPDLVIDFTKGEAK